MLDLRNRENYYELRTAEGDELKIKYPSQKFLTKLTSISDSEDKLGENIDAIYECVFQILNNNTNNKTYSREYVSNLGFEVCVLVIQDYVETVFTNWEK